MLQRVLHGDGRQDERNAGMSPGLRRGAVISASLHAAVVAWLLLGLPISKPPEAPVQTTVSMVFDGKALTSMQAPTPAKVPAPANAANNPPAPPVKQPTKPQPVEAPPPPPPPPPAPPKPQEAPTPPKPTPPLPKPPPTPALAPPLPTPPPPKAPPTPPQPTPPQTQPLPLPPPKVPPPPAKPSVTSQPHITKNPAPNSQALDNTLEKLRQMLQQKKPPKARYNPQAGGAKNGGGNPLGNDTAALSAAQRGAIGDHVRECWTIDAGAPHVKQMSVMLQVTTDRNGVARIANVVGADQAREASDPVYRAFAERAVRAVLDPHCANLPLPRSMMGKINVLTFRFTP